MSVVAVSGVSWLSGLVHRIQVARQNVGSNPGLARGRKACVLEQDT